MYKTIYEGFRCKNRQTPILRYHVFSDIRIVQSNVLLGKKIFLQKVNISRWKLTVKVTFQSRLRQSPFAFQSRLRQSPSAVLVPSQLHLLINNDIYRNHVICQNQSATRKLVTWYTDSRWRNLPRLVWYHSLLQNVNNCCIYSEFIISGTKPLLLKMRGIWGMCQNGPIHGRKNVHDCTFFQTQTYAKKFEKLGDLVFKEMGSKVGQLPHYVELFIRFAIHY